MNLFITIPDTWCPGSKQGFNKWINKIMSKPKDLIVVSPTALASQLAKERLDSNWNEAIQGRKEIINPNDYTDVKYTHEAQKEFDGYYHQYLELITCNEIKRQIR